ncbi:CHRD domain-containing protein [Pedobacter immunditicola]|uniref:CHRD domain-containing protein n=1 Tax=Pedobacter immunditicola TaxID=3133440 RepID=UPI0030AC87A5
MKSAIYSLKGYVFPFMMLLLTVGFVSCSDDDDDEPAPTPTMVNYSGNFVKSNDNVTTTATGTTTATYNTTTRELSYILTWTGLGSDPVGMHFHDAGPIIVPIENFPVAVSGTYSGKATLTVEQANDLAAGRIYSQIHTVNFPGGEVIATLTKSGTSGNGGGGIDY